MVTQRSTSVVLQLTVVFALGTGASEVYDVRFATSDFDNAGSSTGANLNIYGTLNSITDLQLIPAGPVSPKAEIRHIVVESKVPLGNITNLEPRALGGDNWGIEWISVSRRSTNTLWYFYCDNSVTLCRVDTDAGMATSIIMNATVYDVGCYHDGDIFDIAYHTGAFSGGGGSESKIGVSFYGSTGNATSLVFRDQGVQDLKKSLVLRTVPVDLRIGDITQIHLESLGDDGWDLAELQILNRATGSTWDFTCNCDLDLNSITLNAISSEFIDPAVKPKSADFRSMFLQQMSGFKIPGAVAVAIERGPCAKPFCAKLCIEAGGQAYHVIKDGADDACLCEVFHQTAPLQEWQLEGATEAETWFETCD